MKLNIIYLGIFFIISLPLAIADGGHGRFTKPKERSVHITSDQPPIKNTTDENDIHGKLIQKKIINGFDFRLKVVDVKDSVADGGSHNLLVNIKRNGRVQHNLSVTAEVVQLNGLAKSKTMMELGDWYLAGYDLEAEDEYLITILFKSADGVNHRSSINYPDLNF